MSVFIDKQLSSEERFKLLLTFSTHVEIDPKINGKFYYKCGLNMYKQFNNFYKEADWENAYCLYLKYEILFFNKIKQHPNYMKIPVGIKSITAANFRIMKPKSEHCKRELLKLYRRDYNALVDEMKMNKRREMQELDSSDSIRGKYVPISVHSTENLPKSPKYSLKDQKITDVDSNNILQSSITGESAFEIKSQISFNTARKITALEKVKKIHDQEEIPIVESFATRNNKLDNPASAKSSSGSQKNQRNTPTTSTEVVNIMSKKNTPRGSLHSTKNKSTTSSGMDLRRSTTVKSTKSRVQDEIMSNLFKELDKFSDDSLD